MNDDELDFPEYFSSRPRPPDVATVWGHRHPNTKPTRPGVDGEVVNYLDSSWIYSMAHGDWIQTSYVGSLWGDATWGQARTLSSR